MYKDVAVVIPTLNEGEGLGGVLNGLLAEYRGISVIVCDDGSVDETRKVVASFGRRVKFLDRGKRGEHGLTASVLEGIATARTKYVVVMDGDGQHPVEKVGGIVRRLRKGDELVVECRSAVPGWRADRRIVSKGAELLGRARLAIVGRKAPRDVLSGFFGVEREVAMRLIARGKFVKGGYKVLFEMLKAADKDLRMSEVGYVFGGRRGGSSKMGLRHFGYFLKSLFS